MWSCDGFVCAQAMGLRASMVKLSNMSLPRSSVLLLCLALAVLLSACGFSLRGTQELAFENIAVVAPQNGPVAAEMRRALGAKLFHAPDAPSAPLQNATPVTLDILSEQREKTVVGVNAAGQVREFQLRIRVMFRLRSAQGKDLIADTEILQQRDISFNESAVLAKETEESLLYRDMQSDIVQQLMRRLAAVSAAS
jgi:LPS-assembly lipoprotein